MVKKVKRKCELCGIKLKRGWNSIQYTVYTINPPHPIKVCESCYNNRNKLWNIENDS